jgi:phosphatidylglycerol lysyltransferase
MSKASRVLHWSASLCLLALAAWLLWGRLQGMRIAELRAALHALAPAAIAASLACTALSFACLAGYERLATQWLAPGRVPRAVAWRVGLEAHALANTLGFHALTAMALRLRSYRALGIDAPTLAKLVAAIGGCVASGVVAIVVFALAWGAWSTGRAMLVALVAVALVAGIAVLRLRRRQLALRSPVFAHAGLLLALGLVEMAAAIGALAVLLPAGALPSGPAFVLLFVGAMLLGIASHSPGGLGVFEATMLSAAPPPARASVLAALLLYRALYNLLPCALALMAIGIGWARGRHRDPRLNSTADSGA